MHIAISLRIWQVFGFIEKHLAHHGRAAAYIASKRYTVYSYSVVPFCIRRSITSCRYYFGVGGGTEEFMRLVEGSSTLQCDVVKIFEDGVSNIREIIAVRRKSQN